MSHTSKRISKACSVLVLLGLAVPCISLAESHRTSCVNVGALGKSFAEARNNGMPLSQLASNLDYIGESKGLAEGEVLQAKAVAALAYSEYKGMSPDQVQQRFYQSCMKNNK